MRFTLHTNMAKFVGFNMLDISVFFSQKDDILNKIRIALIHLKKKCSKIILKTSILPKDFFKKILSFRVFVMFIRLDKNAVFGSF